MPACVGLGLEYQQVTYSHQLPPVSLHRAVSDGLAPSTVNGLRLNCEAQKRLS